MATGSVKIHPPEWCEGERCPFHNPSDHRMKNWPTHIRFDRNCLVERICPDRGIGHPDPDSLAWVQSRGIDDDGTHGCDGCCQPCGTCGDVGFVSVSGLLRIPCPTCGEWAA